MVIVEWEEQVHNMESWLSGRKHLTANEAGCKNPRGFESLTLRQIVLARDVYKNSSNRKELFLY